MNRFLLELTKQNQKPKPKYEYTINKSSKFNAHLLLQQLVKCHSLYTLAGSSSKSPSYTPDDNKTPANQSVANNVLFWYVEYECASCLQQSTAASVKSPQRTN